MSDDYSDAVRKMRQQTPRFTEVESEEAEPKPATPDWYKYLKGESSSDSARRVFDNAEQWVSEAADRHWKANEIEITPELETLADEILNS